ncbi:MAG: dicarboxylate/amino acid:cation symporter [Bacteroidales bacterium]|nr:dicarboxylate/amino acid:cation symporter [Candidatus Cacconaster merdequi]
MKKHNPYLLLKVVIAIAAGIGCSLFFPDWLTRCFVTFNSLFSNFLGLFIPILIVGLIAPGIFEMGNGAGKMLLITVLLACLSTVFCGFFSYGVCRATYSDLLGDALGALGAMDMSGGLAPYFTIEMPPLMSVNTALVVAFLLGLTLVSVKTDAIKSVMLELKEIVFAVITKLVIPLLPIFIFGIFLKMGAEGKVVAVLGMFLKMILVIFAMHVTVLLVQFCIAGAVARKNPFRALFNMLPAYVTALGTQSSAATIPVTHAQTIKNGVDADVADFVVPLCATVHLSCSMLKIVACAFAVSLSLGMDVSLQTYSGFILMLTITMIAAPGVPGGAIMASLGLLSSILGFDADMQGLMIALYIAMDSFGTAGNVTGDGAIALIINRIKNGKKS